MRIHSFTLHNLQQLNNASSIVNINTKYKGMAARSEKNKLSEPDSVSLIMRILAAFEHRLIDRSFNGS